MNPEIEDDNQIPEEDIPEKVVPSKNRTPVQPKRPTVSSTELGRELAGRRGASTIMGESRRVERDYPEPKGVSGLKGYVITAFISLVISGIMVFAIAPSKADITNLNTRISTTESSLTNGINTLSKDIESRLDTVDSNTKKVSDSVAGLSPQLKSLSSELSTRATATDLDARIKALTDTVNSKVGNVPGDLQILKETVSDLKIKITALDTDISSLKTAITILQASANTTSTGTTGTGKITVALKTFTDSLVTSTTTAVSYSLKLTLANSSNSTISDIKTVITLVSNYSGTLIGTLSSSSEGSPVFTRVASGIGFIQFSNASWGLNLGPLETKNIYLTLYLNQTTVPAQVVIDSVVANPL